MIENGKKRKFQQKYFEEFPWLSYSQVPGMVGGFCRFCVLFGRASGGRGNQPLGVFVKRPLNKFKDAKDQLRAHQVSSYHAFSMAQAQSLLAQMRGEELPVEEQVDEQRRLEAERRRKEDSAYRARLLPIAETVILCGRQELAFRGHRDEGPLDLGTETGQPAAGKESNFKALLRYRALGDEKLRESITNAPKNLLLTSWRVQNELIITCGRAIQEDIVSQVRRAGVFSVIADETTDKGIREQLVIVLRYVDPTGNVREDLISLLNPTETTGSALADAIIDSIQSVGLSTEQLRGQGSEGGGVEYEWQNEGSSGKGTPGSVARHLHPLRLPQTESGPEQNMHSTHHP